MLQNREDQMTRHELSLWHEARVKYYKQRVAEAKDEKYRQYAVGCVTFHEDAARLCRAENQGTKA